MKHRNEVCLRPKVPGSLQSNVAEIRDSSQKLLGMGEK